MPARSAGFRHFILGLLAKQSMSGYDIKHTLQILGWLYPALHSLLKDELVTVDIFPRQNKPLRKVYSITVFGKQALKEWVH